MHVHALLLCTSSKQDQLTIAYRLVNPWTRVGVFVNFCLNASLRLCAGSVDMINTLSLCCASCTARLLLQVVLPTPPLPPTQIHFKLV